jgi:hypothetical protein
MSRERRSDCTRSPDCTLRGRQRERGENCRRSRQFHGDRSLPASVRVHPQSPGGHVAGVIAIERRTDLSSGPACQANRDRVWPELGDFAQMHSDRSCKGRIALRVRGTRHLVHSSRAVTARAMRGDVRSCFRQDTVTRLARCRITTPLRRTRMPTANKCEAVCNAVSERDEVVRDVRARMVIDGMTRRREPACLQAPHISNVELRLSTPRPNCMLATRSTDLCRSPDARPTQAASPTGESLPCAFPAPGP